MRIVLPAALGCLLVAACSVAMDEESSTPGDGAADDDALRRRKRVKPPPVTVAAPAPAPNGGVVDGGPPPTPGATSSGPPPAVTGTSYYVDAANGSDTANGTSPATAWKSLAKANASPLAPGDGLFLKRGSTWTGTLTLAKSG